MSSVPEVTGRDSVVLLQRTLGNRQTANWVSGGVQREPEVEEELGEGDAESNGLEVALKAISNAPEVDETSVIAPEVVEQAKEAGITLGEELSIAKGKPELGLEYEENIRSSEESDELNGVTEGLGELEQYQASLQSGGGKAAPKSEGGLRGKARAGVKRVKKMLGLDKERWDDPSLSNRKKKGANTRKKLRMFGGKLGKKVIGGVRKAGDDLNIGSSVAAALGYVSAGLGAVFALLDVRAAFSSKMKGDELDKLYAELKAKHPEDTGLIDAVKFAVKQKYSKSLTRAVKALMGLSGSGIAIGALVAGVGLFALASNPVGWVVAGVLLGAMATIGAGMAMRRIGRKIFKWFRGDLGLQRRKFAMQLYDRVIAGNGNATAAVASLGLDPAKMKSRAAQPETEDERNKREDAKGFNKVAEQRRGHLEKRAEAEDAAENTQTMIDERRRELEGHEAALRMGVKDIREDHQHRERAARIPGEILSLSKLLEKQKKQKEESGRKADQDAVSMEWKSHPRFQRDDIKLIERKLKR